MGTRAARTTVRLGVICLVLGGAGALVWRWTAALAPGAPTFDREQILAEVRSAERVTVTMRAVGATPAEGSVVPAAEAADLLAGADPVVPHTVSRQHAKLAPTYRMDPDECLFQIVCVLPDGRRRMVGVHDFYRVWHVDGWLMGAWRRPCKEAVAAMAWRGRFMRLQPLVSTAERVSVKSGLAVVGHGVASDAGARVQLDAYAAKHGLELKPVAVFDYAHDAFFVGIEVVFSGPGGVLRLGHEPGSSDWFTIGHKPLAGTVFRLPKAWRRFEALAKSDRAGREQYTRPDRGAMR